MRIKLILLLLITGSLFSQWHRISDRTEGFHLLYNPTTTVNPFTYCSPPDTNTVAGGGYKPITQTTNLNYGEAIMIGQQYRVREAGTVRGCTFYSNSITSLTSIQIGIWRKDGSTYDLIGYSENFVARVVAGQNNTITFTTPITGCLEGDFYSIKTAPNSVVATRGVADASNPMFYITGTSTATDYAWESQTNIAFGIPVTLYMNAPTIVFIGDSQISGSVSGLETVLNSSFSGSLPYKVAVPLSLTYQNMGLGSQSTTQINARYGADAIDLHPKLIVQNGGVNDIAGAVATTTIIANWRNMVETAIGNRIAFYGILILPWTNGTDAQMQQRDSINNQLRTIITSNGGYYISSDTALGVFRTGGDAGNLWDINPLYSDDGVHLNSTGNDILAGLIQAKIQSNGCIAPPSTPTIPFDTAGIVRYLTDENATGTLVNWTDLRFGSNFTQSTSADRPRKTSAVLFDTTDNMTNSIPTQTTTVSVEYIIKITDTNTVAGQFIGSWRISSPLTVLANKIIDNTTSPLYKFGTGYYNNSGYTYKTYSVAGRINKYMHVVIIADSVNKQSVYFNGVLQTSGGAGYSTTFSTDNIVQLGTGMKNALIRRWILYRTKLTPAEITAHYNIWNGLGLIDP
jgi:lysophospholipase L1-like esterase